MTYAASHEKEIPNRSVRRRMEVHQALHCYVCQQTRTTTDVLLATRPRRCHLRLEERLPLAALALRVPALENRLLLVQEMAHRWHLRAVKCGVARAPERLTCMPFGETPAVPSPTKSR